MRDRKRIFLTHHGHYHKRSRRQVFLFSNCRLRVYNNSTFIYPVANLDFAIIKQQRADESKVAASDAGNSDSSAHLGVSPENRAAADTSGAVAIVALARLENPSGRFVNASESTAESSVGGRSTALVTRLYIAHVGDSRAVVSRGGVALELSRDHRAATRPDEVERIVKLGGWVRGDRVLGVLGITRAFGDAKVR